MSEEATGAAQFNADELFAIADCRVPVGAEHWLRGLLHPFESLFPFARVPGREGESLKYLHNPHRGAPEQPWNPEMKRDWVAWLRQEVEARLAAAMRFHELRRRTYQRQHRRWPSLRRSPHIVLFLRQFRYVRYDADIGAHLASRSETDHGLRDRIEKMFPNSPVLWLANPRDDLSLSRVGDGPVALPLRTANNNSIPYIASEDWLASVRSLAQAADVIVMANTKTQGGVAREVAALKELGAIGRTFFSDPNAVDLPTEAIKTLDDLKPERLEAPSEEHHRALLEVDVMRHWAGAASSEYARHYVEAVGICAGNVGDLGGSITHDVFAAVLWALIALLIFRGELRHAASFQRSLATFFRQQPESFRSDDVFAAQTLIDTAKWYEAHADLYSLAHAMVFEQSPPSN